MRVGGVAHHALPLKLFEYMACQRPVIASRSTGMEEIVGDKVLYATDVEEWGAKIKHLYHQVELRQRLGEEGRGLVVANYDWDRLTSLLEEILLSVKR